MARVREEEEADRLMDFGFFTGRGFNDIKALVQDIKRRQHERRADAQERAGGQSGAEILRMFSHVPGVKVVDPEADDEE